MAKSKNGPPYSGRSAEYVIVTYPWGVNHNSRNRVSNDFDRLGAWIQYILHESGIDAVVECIYTVSSRDEVIVQLPYGTNIQPLLGEHKWALIAQKWDGHPNDRRASCIFEYNFRNNGDPGNHNWAEQYPDTHGISVPAKSPYPVPGWIEPPNSIRNLVSPIPPRPLPESGSTNLASSLQDITPSHPCSHATDLSTSHPVPEPSSPPVNNTSLFRPYEPPTQHPAHGTFINQTNQPRDASIYQHDHQISRLAKEENLADVKYIKKIDPYQEEEDAKAFLSLSSQDLHKTLKQEPVKRELTDTDYEHAEYRPSSELMSAIDSLIQEQNEDQKTPMHEGPSVTGPPPYQPSAELVNEINSLIQEQILDKKPSTDEAVKLTQNPRQNPCYQPSAELTDVINTLLQRNASSLEEEKLVLDPRSQKRRKTERGYSEMPNVKLEDV